MLFLNRFVVSLFALLAFAAVGTAQATLTVTPGGSLTEGGSATIAYSNAALAGQTVVVDIDDGGTESDQVSIVLDAQGNGSTTWTVPGWSVAKFNATDANEVSRPILP